MSRLAQWCRRHPKIATALGALVALFVIVGVSNGGGSAEKNTSKISSSDLGTPWPFTVDSGTLKCKGNAVTFTAGGKTYGVNGTATGRDHLPPIDPIWKPNPDIPGTKVNIGPVIDRGLALCAK